MRLVEAKWKGERGRGSRITERGEESEKEEKEKV